MDEEEFELYKQEIEELTELLNEEWLALRDLIGSEGVNLDKTLLVNYYEDEEGGEYGIIVVEKRDVFEFSVRDEKISMEKIDDIESAQKDYPQIEVAFAL